MTTPAPAPDLNWRDNPTAYDQLCDQGAHDLYGPLPEHRNITTITPHPEYL